MNDIEAGTMRRTEQLQGHFHLKVVSVIFKECNK